MWRLMSLKDGLRLFKGFCVFNRGWSWFEVLWTTLSVHVPKYVHL